MMVSGELYEGWIGSAAGSPARAPIKPQGLHDLPLVPPPRLRQLHPPAHLPVARGPDQPWRAPDSPLSGLDAMCTAVESTTIAAAITGTWMQPKPPTLLLLAGQGNASKNRLPQR
jgi:hypothetical protein